MHGIAHARASVTALQVQESHSPWVPILSSRPCCRCKLLPVIAEVDRVLRPEGKLIVRDDMATVKEVQSIARSLHWEVRMTVSKQGQGLLCVRKTMWRPTQVEALS